MLRKRSIHGKSISKAVDIHVDSKIAVKVNAIGSIILEC